MSPRPYEGLIPSDARSFGCPRRANLLALLFSVQKKAAELASACPRDQPTILPAEPEWNLKAHTGRPGPQETSWLYTGL